MAEFDADLMGSDVERQLNSIRNEVSVDPLLSESDELTLSCRLSREFQDDDVYFNQVLSLIPPSTNTAADGTKVTYRTIRYARRDGNCFYRCASFRLFELMLHDVDFAKRCQDRVKVVREDMLTTFGEYSADFCEVVEEVISDILDEEISNSSDLLAAVTNDTASYIIVFFRYAVSTYLRQHSDDFLPFVMGMDFSTVEGYCIAEVDPVDHESDNVQLVAFAKLFDVTLTIETLNRNITGKRPTHHINADQDDNLGVFRPNIFLLFRPGHYDLLETM